MAGGLSIKKSRVILLRLHSSFTHTYAQYSDTEMCVVYVSDDVQLCFLSPDDGFGGHVLDQSVDQMVPTQRFQEPGPGQKLVMFIFNSNINDCGMIYIFFTQFVVL